ncbi:MAG: bacillithiol transferase BstA [Planctomycetes bacterium]|nr:bacillithiol transferase BstA [Planctomycetota bacterium]
MAEPDAIRYPIGPFHFDAAGAPARRAEWIAQVQALPTELAAAVAGLSASQLDTPYRQGGWTCRQVVHHLADSHMNSVLRVKLALTENLPRVKPYDENLWAMLPDSRGDIAPSLALLQGLHTRWALLWRSLTPEDFARAFDHPETGHCTLDWALAHYAWHGRQHTAHIAGLRKRMGW